MKHLKVVLNSLLIPVLFLTFISISYLQAGEVDEQIVTITVPADKTVTEGNSGTKNVTLTVKIDKCPINADIKIHYATRNSSAKAGTSKDYIAKSGNITFTKGSCSKSKSITVKINGDTKVEGNEKFYLDFTNNGTNPNQDFIWKNNDLETKITIKNDDQNQGADLEVRKYLNKSGDGDYVYDLGEVITFRIRAKNKGPADSTIKVVDTLPAGLTLVNITADVTNNFSCSTATKSCKGSHIFKKNQKVWITVTAKASKQGSYKNVAVITDKNGHADTINTGNNTARRWVTVVQGGVNGVFITKTVDNNTPDLFDYVNFTVTVTNRGFNRRLELRDKFPISNADDWSTTGNAFTDISYTIINDPKSSATCEMRTSNNNPYVYCDTHKKYGNDQSLTVRIRAKVIRNNHICNTAHGYQYYWHWKDADTVCMDVYGSYPPTLDPIPDKTAYIGEYFWYNLTRYGHDQDGDPLTYAAAPLPPGIEIVNGIIKKRPTEDGANQTYPVTVTVTDHPANGYPPASASQTFNLKVEYPPVRATNNSYQIETNSSLSGNVMTDNTGNGRDRGYKIKVVNVNPVNVPGGTLTINNTTGAFTFTPDRTFLGQTQFDYTIEDSRGVKDTGTITISVSTDFEDGFQPFELINPENTRNVLGNYVIAGNTIECISSTDLNFDGVCEDNANLISNDRVTKYIDIDGDDSTWNSSSSYITLPNSFDKADKGILWAGLFWQGRYTTDAQFNEAGTERLIRYGKTNGNSYTLEPNINTQDIAAFNANKIKLKIDTGSYNDVTALTLYSNRNYGGVSYAAYADITDFVKNNITAEGRHTFTVANLPTAEGWERDPGLYGGWSLVVIYAEDFKGKVRNVSVYSGYDQIEGDYANSNVDDTELTISGFKLPAAGNINSTLALFSGEGEYPLGQQADRFDRVLLSDDGSNYKYTDGRIPNNANYLDPLDNSFDAKLTNIKRADIGNNKLINNNAGLDVDLFNISSLMTDYRNDDANISSVNIKWETNLDTVNPSMMVFAAELYVPKLCYDYSYKQNGITFSEDNNGTEKPYIRGERLQIGKPITVELYLRNEEASDATLQDVKFDIYDINTTQATYISESTYVTYAKKYVRTHIDDSAMTTSPSFVKDIPLGEIGSKDALYIDYDIDPKNNNIDIPLDGRVNFTLDLLGGISYDLSIYLESMTVCGNDRYAYFPQYDIFNIEDKALSDQSIYDLPTQIVRRVGDYAIISYNNEPNLDARKDVTTMVAVELIDAGKYHDINASCFEPDNTLSERIWIPIINHSKTLFDRKAIENAITNGRTQSMIAGGSSFLPEEIYNKARKNVAFRISYPILDDANNSLMQIKQNGGGWEIDTLSETKAKYPQCSSACKTSGTLTEVAQCLECLYGLNTRLVCSRDNFAIRPKSFRIALSDQNQTDLSSQRSFVTNNDNTNPWNLAAGYTYHMDINATSFTSDASVPGYFGYFDASGEDGNRSIGYTWDKPSNDAHTTNCLDTSDENSTTHFFNGTAGLDIAHNQIGIYKFAIMDKMYTQVDWNPDYMKHQLKAHFLQGIDCTNNSSVSLPEGTATGISSPDLSSVNGCEIASDLTSDGTYTDLTAHLYPYTFNLTGLNATSGPTNKAFVYIDSPSILQSENTNMSYNMNGTYFAADYAGGQLSNFTEGCWADNTEMKLSFTYNHAQPANTNTPYLSYSLQDVNTSNTATVYKPSSGFGLVTGSHNSISTAFSINQEKPFYKTEMAGAITMDLGYNFNRQNNLPLEPRYITFHDFNVTYVTNPSNLYAEGTSNYIVRGNKPLNKNVTFLYGRAKPSKTLYDNVTANLVQTPISVVAHCSLGRTNCQNRGFPLLNAQTSEANWWLVTDHRTADNDGNISIKIGSGAATVSPANVGITGSGINNAVTVTKNSGAAVPMTTVIDLDTGTNKWLIYDPLNASSTLPLPFYRVRFIGIGNWAGHGDTGHVVGGTVNKKKNQRLGW